MATPTERVDDLRTSQCKRQPIYARIYAVVRQVPTGRVASYGQIAGIVGGCTARMVGYAMSAVQAESDVPWHRIINALGKVSPRADGGGAHEQRARLEQEGVVFDAQSRVNWREVRWDGPGLAWLLEYGYNPVPEWQPGLQRPRVQHHREED